MAGLIDTGISYRKQANAAFGQVAKNAAELANANRKLKAAEKAGAWNAAGQGLGMGYMAYESGMLGKGAEKLGMSKDVVNALTPTPTPTPTTPGGSTTVAEDMAAKPLTTPVTPTTPTTGDAMFSGEAPGGNLSAAADVAKAMDPSVATSAVTTNAGNAATNATNTVGQATEAVSGSAPTGGLGTIGGAIEGFGSGMAAGGVAGGIGGGIGGAIGGTVASPLAAAGSLANMAGLTGVGSTLTGAAGTISGGASAAGTAIAGGASAALEGLGALIMAF